MRWLVLVVGIVDLYLKYLSMSGENAVINLGVSGGIVLSEWLIGLGLTGVLYFYLKDRSIGLWMVLVGGVVNVVSRVIWGGVVDYWSLFGVLHNNLADYLIVGGCFLCVATHTRILFSCSSKKTESKRRTPPRRHRFTD